MTTALIDGDLMIFQVCAAAEYGIEPDDVDLDDVCRSIESRAFNIMKASGADSKRIFLTKGNYRHFITGDYKANREGVWRPECLKHAMSFAEAFMDAEYQQGLEADDLLAINQTEDTIICTLDKDLKQVDGRHYRWAHGNKDEEFANVTEGWRSLYYQGLIGDSTDGIIGCGKRVTQVYKTGAKAGQEYERRKGIGPKQAEAIINECKTEKQAFEAVLDQYYSTFGKSAGIQRFYQQMRLVHMVREFDGAYAKLYGDVWMNPATGEMRLDG